MKKYSNLIKLSMAFLGLILLFSFSNNRNNRRLIQGETKVEFLDDNAHFITRNTVNKMLIQNQDSVSRVAKESLVLNKVEAALNANQMIAHADVYVTINGEVGAKVHQRTPIARVVGEEEYYMDISGEKMPLSSVYSARVPLITGTTNVDKVWPSLYKLTKYVYQDELLKKTVTGIRLDGQHYILALRDENFDLYLTKVENLDLRFNNFKAFYQKAKKDKTLENYKMVNLSFDNQVVCTKK